ncbi:MAG: nucleotide sugar dehydrogenase [Actinobacteria bacterium]|nr:nucleotide sugar dehydrogenase [Actinomycetota bacterium]
MNYKDDLLNKIKLNSAKVGIIGLGYVGLPLAIEFSLKDFNVIGFDIDPKKIQILNSGRSFIKHIDSKKILTAVNDKKFFATNDFSKLVETDAVIVCVPTPLNENREPDMTFVKNTAEVIQKYIRKGQLITLESTTYPGTTEELLLPLFENPLSSHEKFLVGKDFFLAFSPEREDPNNPDFTTSTIPKVIGGVTKDCLEVTSELYNKIITRTIPVSSTRAAEATKLLENIYRSVNIALVNELKMVFDKMGIDIWEVIDAAKTKPFGFNAFYPGPGLGGHCIPIDPFYLSWKAKEFDISTKFIELAGEINTYQPYYVVEKLIDVLNTNGRSLKDSKILIVGIAYKKNVDDLRESPSLKLIEILNKKYAKVDYYDPYIPEIPKTRKYDFDLKSISLTENTLSKYEVILLSTDHDNLDYEMIHRSANLILDTRNIFERKNIISDKIFKA